MEKHAVRRNETDRLLFVTALPCPLGCARELQTRSRSTHLFNRPLNERAIEVEAARAWGRAVSAHAVSNGTKLRRRRQVAMNDIIRYMRYIYYHIVFTYIFVSVVKLSQAPEIADPCQRAPGDRPAGAPRRPRLCAHAAAPAFKNPRALS